MLSNASKYAIRAVLFLALQEDSSQKWGAEQLAKELETPKPYLAHLLRNLKNQGLISSTKGPGGGFFLDNGNLERSLWEIVEIIDGPERFNECFLGLPSCDNINPCPAHAVFAPFKKDILADFKHKTIREFARESAENGTVISLKNKSSS